MTACTASIETLKAWIDNNHRMDLLIDDVVKKSGWSKWHLQRSFFEAAGVKLGQYLFDRRMDASLQMLRSGVPLIDIADRIGYEQQSSFQRAFKRKYGVSPKRYIAIHGP